MANSLYCGAPFWFWRKCIPRLRKGSAGSDDFPREPYALWRKGNRPIKETFAPPESQIDVDDRGRADAVNRAYSFSLASLLEHLPYLRTSQVIPYLFRFLALYWCTHLPGLSLNGENKFDSFTGCYLTKEWSSLCYPLVTRFLSRRRRGWHWGSFLLKEIPMSCR